MKSLLLILFSIVYPIVCLSQGKLMLVGGGSELDDAWSWSNTPYQWAVDQSSNKKVAIISFSSSSDPNWLPDYFKSLGATAAANFVINTSEAANSQQTYDDLMAYDVFFFKGGDQSNYYTTYKSSKVAQAIVDKYNAGGVIGGTSAGMAILSDVIYSAESSSVYPDQILKNIYDPAITLKDDFTDLLNGYITDTHFIERGRFSRLIGFMGNWYLNNNENISGIGVDDRTAFCINADMIGTAYGTGAVSIYSTNQFQTNGSKPVADSVHAVQLIHGMSYDLTQKSLTNTYSMDISPAVNTENGYYTLYLSGSEPISHNGAWLSEFIAESSSEVIVISRPGTSIAGDYISHLENNSSLNVQVLYTEIESDSCGKAGIRNTIKSGASLIFVDNDHEKLLNYLSGDATGKTLKEHIASTGRVIAFAGKDSKLAGSYYVTNNEDDALNAYNGSLTFDQGLGLLESTIIMPDVYDPSSSDFYENNSAAVKYAMVDFKLRYGLYINENSYVKFYQESNSNYFNSFGDYSSILLTNTGNAGSIANQQVDADGNTRNVVGFDQMQYSLLSKYPVKVGTPEHNQLPEVVYEAEAPIDLAANYQDQSVLLTWTAAPGAVTGYKIERSDDKAPFTQVGTTSAGIISFTDEEITSSVSYKYRVQTINNNSVSCYSNEVSANRVTSIQSASEQQIFIPNPVINGKLEIKNLPEQKYFSLLIYNTKGSIVLNRSYSQASEKVLISKLPSDIYIVKLIGSDYIMSNKVLIINQ